MEPEVVITSGNLVDAHLYDKVGGFDERLFVDYVDHDFYLRGRRMGFDVIVCADAKLYHTIGEASALKLPFWRTRFISGHSPERRYTMSRNRLRMIRIYRKDFPGYAFWTCVEYLQEIAGIFLLETRRLEKLRGIFRGIWDSEKYFAHRP